MPVLTDRHVCLRCQASFHPDLVGGSCPVCRTPVSLLSTRRGLSVDDRTLLLVGLAAIANLLVLSFTAIALL